VGRPSTAVRPEIAADELIPCRQAAENLADVMRALSNATRIQAVLYLASRDCCAVGVCELARHLQIPSANMSYHLKELWEAGVLAKTRHKNTVSYWIEPACVPLIEFLATRILQR